MYKLNIAGIAELFITLASLKIKLLMNTKLGLSWSLESREQSRYWVRLCLIVSAYNFCFDCSHILV